MHRFAILALTLTAATAGAQRAPGRYLLQANPLGVAVFGPTVELLTATSPSLVTAVGVRFISMGMVPQANAEAENDVLRFSWTATVSLLHHPNQGMLGWFGGPRVEFGFGRTDNYKDQYSVIAAEVGYRWKIGSEYAVALGGGLGLGVDQYKHHTIVTDRGTDYYPFGGASLAFGWFFGPTP